MKTDRWKHIGIVARSLAARLVAAREEFEEKATTARSIAGHAAEGHSRGDCASEAKGGPTREGKAHRPGAAEGAFGKGGRSGWNKGGPAADQQLAHRDRRVVMSPLSPASNRPWGNGATTRTQELRAGHRSERPDPIGRCSGLHGSWYACPLCVREIQIADVWSPLDVDAGKAPLQSAHSAFPNQFMI